MYPVIDHGGKKVELSPEFLEAVAEQVLPQLKNMTGAEIFRFVGAFRSISARIGQTPLANLMQFFK